MKHTKNSHAFSARMLMYIPLSSEHICTENKHIQKNLPDSENHPTYDLRV